jgi:hypothetical protein
MSSAAVARLPSSQPRQLLPPRPHGSPVDVTPVFLRVIEQVFRHASMCEHELGAAARERIERNGRHRVDALGKILSTPRLHQPTSRHEIHVHAGDLPRVGRELAADLVAHDGLAAGDFRALARVGKQVVDCLG